MKVVILAGGYGTRITEESQFKPKPMIEIGSMPILWHIMKYYSGYGFNEFVICAGYKSEVIKDFFAKYYLYASDVEFDLRSNSMSILKTVSENWKVTVVDTGLETMTGGRLKRVEKYIDGDFLMTYGDGVSNVDIGKLLEFHNEHGKKATLTAVKPEGRFGVMDMEGSRIVSFREKSDIDTGWINGGFMVLSTDIFKYIDGDHIMFEREPLERISADGQLLAYKHEGFWQCMDTQRDKQLLESLWEKENPPWKNW